MVLLDFLCFLLFKLFHIYFLFIFFTFNPPHFYVCVFFFLSCCETCGHLVHQLQNQTQDLGSESMES